jgi:hypothetical protein
MTDLQSGSTIREIINFLKEVDSSDTLCHIYQTVALVAALGTIEHRLDGLVNYIASIDSSLRKE